MINQKMQVFQQQSESGNTYLIFRYYDDLNNNYEYQIYKLVQSKAVARDFGVTETKNGRHTPLNTREMCDEMIRKIENK